MKPATKTRRSRKQSKDLSKYPKWVQELVAGLQADAARSRTKPVPDRPAGKLTIMLTIDLGNGDVTVAKMIPT